MSDLEERVRIIEERNHRVESDKAWEISWTRRILISVVTCIAALVLLHGNLWETAVAVLGYLLSTFSMPIIKKMWVDSIYKRKT